jgi:hypothetical protein
MATQVCEGESIESEEHVHNNDKGAVIAANDALDVHGGDAHSEKSYTHDVEAYDDVGCGKG